MTLGLLLHPQGIAWLPNLFMLTSPAPGGDELLQAMYVAPEASEAIYLDTAMAYKKY